MIAEMIQQSITIEKGSTSQKEVNCSGIFKGVKWRNRLKVKGRKVPLPVIAVGLLNSFPRELVEESLLG